MRVAEESGFPPEVVPLLMLLSAMAFMLAIGITMAGGSSLLRGLTTVISNATGLDVKLAEDPLTCVARGTAVYLENLELWKDTMESDADDL